jgi:hypothetical protein
VTDDQQAGRVHAIGVGLKSAGLESRRPFIGVEALSTDCKGRSGASSTRVGLARKAVAFGAEWLAERFVDSTAVRPTVVRAADEKRPSVASEFERLAAGSSSS